MKSELGKGGRVGVVVVVLVGVGFCGTKAVET